MARVTHSLGEVAALFLRLGLTAFGGPAAHIAVIEEECVRRRAWITRERFLDVLGASSLIPGPTSTELVMHVGYQRAGWPGLVVAGVCFILPAALVVGVIAAAYAQAGRLPALDGVLRAVKPVAVVVILQALVGLGRGVIRSWAACLVVGASAAAVFAGIPEVAVLVGAGLLWLAGPTRAAVTGITLAALGTVTLVASGPLVVGAPSLFAYFVKAGSVIFGSGYVLFAVLRTDLVGGLRWLTEAQLLDAIAVGQVTPGPVFTSATFIGYLLGGVRGATVATIGIFLPAFVSSAVSVSLLHRVRESPHARRFLTGVNAAAVALIGLVALTLGRAALVDGLTIGISGIAALLIGPFRMNSSWVLGLAALAGWVCP